MSTGAVWMLSAKLTSTSEMAIASVAVPHGATSRVRRARDYQDHEADQEQAAVSHDAEQHDRDRKAHPRRPRVGEQQAYEAPAEQRPQCDALPEGAALEQRHRRNHRGDQEERREAVR